MKYALSAWGHGKALKPLGGAPITTWRQVSKVDANDI